jgi:uncharacterized protein (TIGR00369 family)
MTAERSALRQRFESTPYHRALGIRVETLEADRVVLRVPYKDENSNPGRALHGGVAASTIGIAGALAAWSGIEAAPTLDAATLDLSVHYLAAAIGEDIVAEAAVLRRGKEIVYSDVNVRNDAGKPIAKGLLIYRAVDVGTRPATAGRQLQSLGADVVGRDPAGDSVSGDVPKLARAIVSVPFMARLGLLITHMKDGRSRVEMPFDPEHADDTGAVHEGAIAALLDTSGAMASWSVTGIDFRYKASTVGIHVNYHAPARGEGLVAHGQTLRRNDEIFLNTVAVTGRDSDRLVASGAVTYRIVVPDPAADSRA